MKLGGLRCALSFFTIIPSSCSEFSKGMIGWIFSAGLIIGALAGLIYYFSFMILGPVFASAAAMAVLLLMSGFNHLDGVLDTGDALVYRGNRERRLEILKDHYLGAGGFGSALVIYLITFGALTAMNPISGSLALVSAEVFSKASFVLAIYTGKPLFPEGLFTNFRKLALESGPLPLIVNLSVALIISLISGLSYVASILFSLVLYFFILMKIEKYFGGINGDIIGFLGEIARVLFLVTTAILLVVLRAPPFP